MRVLFLPPFNMETIPTILLDPSALLGSGPDLGVVPLRREGISWDKGMLASSLPFILPFFFVCLAFVPLLRSFRIPVSLIPLGKGPSPVIGSVSFPFSIALRRPC